MTTNQKLIDAATTLLDAGGEDAVTLRAVGHAAGVSHNAPYKHFASRSALLAAVAASSFEELTMEMRRIGASSHSPMEKLLAALRLFTDYNHHKPARYRLLFNDPATAAAGGDLRAKAMDTFEQFQSLVSECQDAGQLPKVPSQAMASLIFATAHGLLTMERNGQMHPEKGLSTAANSMELLLCLLTPVHRPS